jgi:hypothetical protein
MGPDTMSDTQDTRWLSYDDLAKALGITPDSARRLVSRKKWPRKTGNDGRALIAVPAERLAQDNPPAVHQDNAPVIVPAIVADTAPDTGDDILPVVRVLTGHIEKLEQQLEMAQAELTEERARAATLTLKAAEVDALNTVLEAERQRIEDLKAERDRWAAQAERLAMPAPAPARRGFWPFRWSA